ncbi:metallophosphoesterase [Streptomyces sp. NPDC088178]|uniref:metallophosphoesterase n=1 Tax=Streptomyces sp. NPDC088178 TaxID=3365836 RepID=UPI003803752D
MDDLVQLGDRVGLIGDVHGNARFLRDAVVTLVSPSCTSLVQLGDFGMVWSGTRSETRTLEVLNEQLAGLGVRLYVVLGNHENYDAIDALPRDISGFSGWDRIWRSSPTPVSCAPASTGSAGWPGQRASTGAYGCRA